MANPPTGGSPFDFQANPDAVEGVDYIDGYHTIRAFDIMDGQLLNFFKLERALRNLLRCSNYFPCLHAGRLNGKHASDLQLTVSADSTDGIDSPNLVAGTNITIAVSGSNITISAAGSGDVSGPASSTNGNVASFSGITGKLIQDAGFAASAVYRSGGTDVAVADGGTGASDASTARTNLGAYGSGDNISVGTIASGAHTITQATVGNTVQQLVSTATNDDPTHTVTQHRTTSSGTTPVDITIISSPTSGKTWAVRAVLNMKDTGVGTSESGSFFIEGSVRDHLGTTTISAQNTNIYAVAGLSAATAVLAIDGSGNVVITVTGVAGYSLVWHAHVEIFGPTGT